MRNVIILIMAWLMAGVGIGASYLAGRDRKINRLG